MLAAGLLVTACDRSSRLDYDEPPEGTLQSILELKALWKAGGTKIAREFTIRGTVTANDHYGEVVRTLVLEDASGALPVAVDQPALYRTFPFGSTVTVQCNGLALGSYGGTLHLGAEPDATYGVSRIPAAEIGRYLRREAEAVQPEALRLAFDEVTADHISRYVRFDGIRFERPGSWCDLDPATQQPVTTERTIVDAAGRTFTVRTRATCSYATEPVPTGTGSLYGIIDCFNGKYTLCVTARRILFTASATPPKAGP